MEESAQELTEEGTQHLATHVFILALSLLLQYNTFSSSDCLSENCLFGTGMPQYWPQGGAVETIAPHLLGLAASISKRATSTY